MSPTSSLKHHFLLAMPGLAPDYFGGSIIYVCEHNEDGAMGLIVNRVAEFTLAELLDHLGIDAAATPEGPALEGGPVQTDRGFILHSDETADDASLAIGDGVMLSTARQTLEAIGRGNGPVRFLVALGYAGWGPGQLEQELAQNAWLTCPASTDVLFDVPLDQRVDRAAATLGIDFRLMTSQAGNA